MKIYLVFGSVGGWTLRGLLEAKDRVLTSYVYDKKAICNLTTTKGSEDESKKSRVT